MANWFGGRGLPQRRSPRGMGLGLYFLFENRILDVPLPKWACWPTGELIWIRLQYLGQGFRRFAP